MTGTGPPSRKFRLPFRYVEPAFFGGLLDDPLLFVRIRPMKRALLFDCGQIGHLAKRVIKPIDTVFISHAHMDHAMGVPTLVRHKHASPRPLDIYGPPGIAERIHHQLQGFDWNLSEPDWFTIRIHEVHRKRIMRYRLIGPKGFAHSFDGEETRASNQIWSCRYASVHAELLDHRLPVLAFKLVEQPVFYLDKAIMQQMGLTPGEWIRDLKLKVWKQGPEPEAGSDQTSEARASEKLYQLIRGTKRQASIGYLCDVGRTKENEAVIADFFEEVTLLCADCTFLANDVDKARASYHLCTTDVNELVATLKPQYLLPMHLSKSYLHRVNALYDELTPPAGIQILRLPAHIVPPPLTVRDVNDWLRPE